MWITFCVLSKEMRQIHSFWGPEIFEKVMLQNFKVCVLFLSQKKCTKRRNGPDFRDSQECDTISPFSQCTLTTEMPMILLDQEAPHTYTHTHKIKRTKATDFMRFLQFLWPILILNSRYGNGGKTGTTMSTIAILWPVKAMFEKRAAAVEADISFPLRVRTKLRCN